jgi:dTDP-L-rhamnose 4-epimerase
MNKNILITGGAGFIGSHLCDELIKHGYKVRVLDNLSPQVHGQTYEAPDYLNEDVEFIEGDVCIRNDIKDALKDTDAVFHLAASVGVGQSMYEIYKYTYNNNLGTATLLEEIIKQPVTKLIVASSMSIYGEGLYKDTGGNLVNGQERPVSQLKAGQWDLYDNNGKILQPVPTPETKTPILSSIYALSKYDQEKMCLITGRAYDIPTVALRFFNVFGTRQSLSNPYTGVLAIFASRFLNDNPPIIYEDGNQKRDFVSVYDVVQACRLALEVQEANGQVFNVGSGNPYSIAEVADKMSKMLGKSNQKYVIKGKYRIGDIRHCFADISLAQKILGYNPKVSLDEGLVELSNWLKGQMSNDRVDEANSELEKRGLTL